MKNLKNTTDFSYYLLFKNADKVFFKCIFIFCKFNYHLHNSTLILTEYLF